MRELTQICWKIAAGLLVGGLLLFFINGVDNTLGMAGGKMAVFGLVMIMILQLGGFAGDVWLDIKPMLFPKKKPHNRISPSAPGYHPQEQLHVRQEYRTRQQENDDLIP